MSGFVGLDPVAATTLADRLDEAAVDLEAHADRVARLLAQADISSSNAPAEIRDVAAWARYRSRDLRRRVVAITAAARGGSGVQLRGFLLADRSQARTAGRDLGKKVGGLLGSGVKKKLDAALADLKRYGNDPAYATAFFKGLGSSRTYALLTATAGHDNAAIVGSALVLARRTGGITVQFIDGIVTAARKAAVAIQAYTGALSDKVNVLGGTQNCVNCVVAGDATLSGSPASALDSLGPQPISKLEAMFGGTFKDVAGQGEIQQLLNEAGSGARGIVYGAREGAAGHVFLAVNQGGIVRFLDPQAGGVASFDGYASFKFLWTNGP